MPLYPLTITGYEFEDEPVDDMSIKISFCKFDTAPPQDGLPDRIIAPWEKYLKLEGREPVIIKLRPTTNFDNQTPYRADAYNPVTKQWSGGNFDMPAHPATLSSLLTKREPEDTSQDGAGQVIRPQIPNTVEVEVYQLVLTKRLDTSQSKPGGNEIVVRRSQCLPCEYAIRNLP